MPVRHDLAAANRLLQSAKNMLGGQAYSCQWENHYTLGEQIDEYFAEDPVLIWHAVYDPSPRRKQVRRIMAEINNDLAEDWTWD